MQQVTRPVIRDAYDGEVSLEYIQNESKIFSTGSTKFDVNNTL